MHQVILNMIVTKHLANKAFEYIDPWGENLAYTAYEIRASYHLTIKATPGQDVFGRDIIFNLASVVDWRVKKAGKKRQLDIEIVQENARRVTYDCEIGYLVYVEMTGIYRRLYYKKYKTYRITEVFTNGTV